MNTARSGAEHESCGDAVRLGHDRAEEWFDSAPPVVLLEGELGVGKSHLLRKLRERYSTQARIVLAGRCSPDDGDLQPVLEAILANEHVVPRAGSPVLGALVPLLPELAARLPPSLAPLPRRLADRARCFRALREILSQPRPTVLLLDDVQWADDATRAFLGYLVRRPSTTFAMVLAYRPHENPPRLSHLGGPDFPVRHVVLDPPDTSTAETCELRTPILDVYAEQLHLCGANVRAVVRAAAIDTGEISETELRSLAGLTESATRQAIRKALSTNLIREVRPNHYACHRELARQAVYALTSSVTKRHLHRTAATLRRQDPVWTARHLYHAGNLDEWLSHSRHNADAAIQNGDWNTAVQLLRDVLRHATLDIDERVELAMALSRAASDGLEYSQTVSTVREILDEVELPDATRGELRNNLGILLLSQAGDHDEGYRQLEQAVDELRESNPALALTVMSSLAIPYTGQRHISTHLRWLNEVEAGLGTTPLPDPHTTATIRVNRLTTLMTVGAPEAWDAAEFVLDDTKEPLLARQRMRGCLNLVDSTSWLGHYTAARRYLTRGIQWSHQLGAAYLTEQLHVAEVLFDWLRGDWSTLRETTEALIARYETLPRVASECHLVAGAIALEQGDTTTAMTYLADASATRQHSAAAPPVSATAAALLARHHYNRGAKAAAMHELTAALTVIRDTGMWVWASEIVPFAVELLHHAGRAPDALQLLDDMKLGLQDRNAPAAQASLTLGTAIALDLDRGEPDYVLEAYDTALQSLAAVPRPYWTAVAHVLRDRYARTVLQQKTDDLAIAINIFTTLGATASERRCRGILHTRQPRQRGRPGYGQHLSPRESEVAELASSGHTNAQIADRLGLSVRTIEQHIAQAMRKTGATSRYGLH